jgi:stearoyl-CoA desaturase (delta-9 desaturase)
MSSAKLLGRGTHRDLFRLSTIPFWGVHVAAVVGVLALGFSWEGLVLAIASYFFRMFFVTAGYHRYFSHRAFKTSRAFAFVLAFFAEASSQKGVAWWAAHHRVHHKHSDQPEDPHSAKLYGLLWSHLGWILSGAYEDHDERKVKDITRYPELRWLSRHWYVPPVAYAVGLFAIGGWEWLVWGFFVSTTLLWHGTFTINSLTHVWGKPRFPSGDASKNHWLLAILTMGEGWHNNHHYYQSSANQGFYFWEYDFSYYLLRVLALFGIVWDLRKPPAEVLALGRDRDALFVTAKALEAKRSAAATRADGAATDVVRA